MNTLLLKTLCAVVLGSAALAEPVRSAAPSHLPEGTYLSQDYIKKINQSLSPHVAWYESHKPQALEVQKDEVLAIVNFHEGYPLFRSSSIRVGPTFSRDLRGRDCYFRASGDMIEYGDSKPLAKLFNFVGEERAYVGRMVLVGRYRDPMGRNYEFKPDGILSSPNGTCHFEIGLDTSDFGSDFYTTYSESSHDKTRHVEDYFEYVREGPVLRLYKRQPNVPRSDKALPDATLTRL